MRMERREQMSRQWMRERRESLGMSQGALADRIGMTQQEISRVEVGGRSLRVGTAKAIADALDVPWEWFYDPPTAPQGNSGMGD